MLGKTESWAEFAISTGLNSQEMNLRKTAGLKCRQRVVERTGAAMHFLARLATIRQ